LGNALLDNLRRLVRHGDIALNRRHAHAHLAQLLSRYRQ